MRADREVLAQHRQRTCSASGGKIGGRPTEELDIGEDRQTRRAACFVVLGKHCWVEPDGEIAFGRRTSLDLGDDRHLAGFSHRDERVAEAPCRRQQPCPLDQCIERTGIEIGRVPMRDEDPIEIGAQAGRPLLSAVGVAMTIIGGSAISGVRVPNRAPMASLPPRPLLSAVS